MVKRLVICFGLVLVFNCGDDLKPKKPDNLIPKDKMSDILYDLYILNSAKGINRSLLEKNGIVPEQFILEKHNIDSLQFATSNSYYSYDSNTYKSIVAVVKVRIEAQKDSLSKLEKKRREKQKKRRDSLREARKNKRNDKNRKVDSAQIKALKKK